MGTVVLVLVVLILAYAIGMPWYAGGRAKRAVGKPIPAVGPVVDASRPALVYFFSPTCGPCRQMAPTLEALRQEGAAIHKVDVSQDLASAMAYGVMVTPTTVAVRDGRVAEVVVGMAGMERLKKLLA